MSAPRWSVVVLAAALPACIDVSLSKSDEADSSAPIDDCAADEVPYDGVDNDCDPGTRDDDLDADGLDGVDDCDDTDPGLGGGEIAYDGVDNDCDPTTPDDDLDGDGALRATDCDESDPARHPDATEVCDGVDNDCDGAVDGDAAADATPWYADADGDAYGDAATAILACEAPDGYLADAADCDDTASTINPLAAEVCNGADDDCDGAEDEEGVCPTGGYGGHRIDKDGDYYYALYNDDGFGILGTSEWYGSSDASNSPEGVTWNEDQTVLYYNDLAGNVWAQSEPFDATSTLVGTFVLGQIGGGVVFAGTYYVGDYANGNIYAMDVASGATSLYASLGSSACKPYFGNSAMAIDTDGQVYAASSCGVVVYTPGSDAAMLNSYSGLISAVAMDAANELYGLDNYGNIVHFDKATGAELGHVTVDVTPSVTWTMAVDGNGDFVLNYWGEQRLFSGLDGSLLYTWNASSYYPGTSGYYWYVTF